MLGGMICYVDNDLALMYTLDGLLYCIAWNIVLRI